MSAVLTRRAALSGAVASVALVGAAAAATMPLVNAVDRSAWTRALAAYSTARATSDTCPSGHPDEDALVDRYCAAMDVLILDTPAPDWPAVLQKVDWASDRQEGFAFVPEYLTAIRADVARLAKLEG